MTETSGSADGASDLATDPVDTCKSAALRLLKAGDVDSVRAGVELLKSVSEIETHRVEVEKLKNENQKLLDERSPRQVSTATWRFYLTWLAPLLSTLVLAGTLGLQAISYRASESERGRAAAAESRRLRQEQFGRWAELLRPTNTSVVRLGGIYGLGLLARESAEYHWPAMRILSAFVRERRHSAGRQEDWDTIDIQTAINIVSSRDLNCANGVSETLDLTEADLHGLYLPSVNFRGFDLFGANLESAFLEGADLSGADVGGQRSSDLQTKLQGADLWCADLRNVILSDAQVRDLFDGNIADANVHGATIRGHDANYARSVLVDDLKAVDYRSEADWDRARRQCAAPPSQRPFTGEAHCSPENEK